jgi:hypothetical protein
MMQKVTLEIKMSKKSKIYKQVPASRTPLTVVQTGEVSFAAILILIIINIGSSCMRQLITRNCIELS